MSNNTSAIKEEIIKPQQRKIGAILSYISIIASTLVQLIYTPFLISKLGQSEYGLYSLVSSIIGYLTVLDLGFGNAIIVYTSKYRAIGDIKKEQALHGMFHYIYIGIGAVAGIAGVIMALYSDSIFGATMTVEELGKMRTMLFILSFNLAVTFAFSIYNSIITASEQFVFQKTLAIINTVAKPILMIPILFMGYKSIALCLVITTVNIAVLFSNYIFCKKKLNIKIKFSGFDKKLFKIIFAYSFWIFLTQIVDKINWSADQFILGAVSGTIAVSVYSAAATINTMFVQLSTAISNVMLPKVSKMVAKGANDKELSDEFIKVGRIQFLIMFLVLTGLILEGRNFINIWLGNGFEETYVVMLFLITPAIVSLSQNTGLAIMQAKDKFRFKALTTFAMALVNIVISIFLAKAFGAAGAAFGTSISIVITNIIVMNIYYKKVIGLDIGRFWKNIIHIIIKLCAPILITVALINYTGLEGKKALLTYSSFYAIIYVITAYLFVMNPYEKKMVDSVLIKLHLKRKK